MTEYRRDDFLVSTDPALLDHAAIGEALRGTYWAAGRKQEVIERSLENSLVFGLYHDRRQIGMVRVVTDRATFAWLCDVYIDQAYRAKGLGSWLMECVMAHPDMQGLRRILLATRDAQEFYRRFGFNEIPAPERWMEVRNPDA